MIFRLSEKCQLFLHTTLLCTTTLLASLHLVSVSVSKTTSYVFFCLHVFFSYFVLTFRSHYFSRTFLLRALLTHSFRPIRHHVRHIARPIAQTLAQHRAYRSTQFHATRSNIRGQSPSPNAPEWIQSSYSQKNDVIRLQVHHECQWRRKHSYYRKKQLQCSPTAQFLFHIKYNHENSQTTHARHTSFH